MELGDIIYFEDYSISQVRVVKFTSCDNCFLFMQCKTTPAFCEDPKLSNIEEKIMFEELNVKTMTMEEYGDFELNQMCRSHDDMLEKGLIKH